MISLFKKEPKHSKLDPDVLALIDWLETRAERVMSVEEQRLWWALRQMPIERGPFKVLAALAVAPRLADDLVAYIKDRSDLDGAA